MPDHNSREEPEPARPSAEKEALARVREAFGNIQATFANGREPPDDPLVKDFLTAVESLATADSETATRLAMIDWLLFVQRSKETPDEVVGAFTDILNPYSSQTSGPRALSKLIRPPQIREVLRQPVASLKRIAVISLLKYAFPGSPSSTDLEQAQKSLAQINNLDPTAPVPNADQLLGQLAEFEVRSRVGRRIRRTMARTLTVLVLVTAAGASCVLARLLWFGQVPGVANQIAISAISFLACLGWLLWGVQVGESPPSIGQVTMPARASLFLGTVSFATPYLIFHFRGPVLAAITTGASSVLALITLAILGSALYRLYDARVSRWEEARSFKARLYVRASAAAMAIRSQPVGVPQGDALSKLLELATFLKGVFPAHLDLVPGSLSVQARTTGDRLAQAVMRWRSDISALKAGAREEALAGLSELCSAAENGTIGTFASEQNAEGPYTSQARMTATLRFLSSIAIPPALALSLNLLQLPENPTIRGTFWPIALALVALRLSFAIDKDFATMLTGIVKAVRSDG